MIGTQEGTYPLLGEGDSNSTTSTGCRSGRRSHTRRIITEHGRSQEYCEVRNTVHRKDMDSTIPIHQAAVKASSRREYTITEGHLSQPSYSTVLHPITKEWRVNTTIVTDNERMVESIKIVAILATGPFEPKNTCTLKLILSLLCRMMGISKCLHLVAPILRQSMPVLYLCLRGCHSIGE